MPTAAPIRNPKQLLLAVSFSFVVPVFAIIGLVYFVVSGSKPSGSGDKEAMALGGVVQTEQAHTIATRIARVGSAQMRDPNRVLKTGEEVFKAQCTTCHTAGVAGAPKLGDSAAWAPRIRTGFEALVNSALHGKGAMPAQGGGDFEDTEVARGVAFMAAAAGAKFPEPQAPAVAAAPAATTATIVASPDVVTAMAAINRGAAAPAVAVAAASPGAAAAAAGPAPALYTQVCSVCHVAGVAGAPKFGDKAAWAPRIATGIDALHASVLKGKGAMPPKGGSTASDADIRAVVQYMVNAAK